MQRTTAEERFTSALSYVLHNLNISLKRQQEDALKAFVLHKRDVCAVLPTGYGKSLIYQLAPLVAKRMNQASNPVVVVVSPLIALMDQQVKEANKLGVTAMQLGVHTMAEIVSNAPNIIFGSPESWLLNKNWRHLLSTLKDIIGIVVDEVHLTYKWGQSEQGKSAFRESFARLGELRSIVTTSTPVLALTASADLESVSSVKRLLLLDHAATITESPNRRNIRLGLKHISGGSLECLDWIVKEAKLKGLSMSPVIIYGRTLKDVGRLFCYLKAELGECAWVGKDPERKAENLLIGMFHSKTLEDNKKRVMSSLSGEGNCRVVVATTALGMGINFPRISHVVLYGVPNDLEGIVQEIGRAGRDGSLSHAVVYSVKQHTKVDEKVKYLLNIPTNLCIRKCLFSHFEQNSSSVEPGHQCCTYCHLRCHCQQERCNEPMPEYELDPKNSSGPAVCREVTENDKVRLTSLLHQYQSSLLHDSTSLYTSKEACTGFSPELIEEVLQHSANIFDLKYITTNLPVFNITHAQNILHIFEEVFGDIDDCPTLLPPQSISPLDINYAGYFDKPEDEEASSLGSLESGVSQLLHSD